MEEYNLRICELNMLKTLCNLGVGKFQKMAIIDLSIRHMFAFNGRLFSTKVSAASMFVHGQKQQNKKARI
jgi:hypothetical protein